MNTRIKFLEHNLQVFQKMLEKKAADDKGNWITVKGTPIFIPDGQSKDDVINKKFEDKEKSITPIIKPMSEFRKQEDVIGDEQMEKIYDAFHFSKSAAGIDYSVLQTEITQELRNDSKSQKIMLEINSKRNESLKKLKNILSSSVYSDLKKQLEHEDKVNTNMTNALNSSKYVYRGVSKSEYESIQKNGKLTSNDSLHAEFKYASLLPVAGEQFTGDYMLRFNREQLGNNVTPLLFSTFDNINNMNFYRNDNSFEHTSVAIKNNTPASSIDMIFTNQKTKKHSSYIASVPQHLNNYKGKDGFFIKKFLISDKINLNGWRVTDTAIKKDLDTFIGKPVVLTPEQNHPAVKDQEQYKVGEIIDVGYDSITHTAWQVSSISDKKTQKLILAGKIKYGSPTVHSPMDQVDTIHKNTAAESDTLHRFLGKHDALVAEPAYGKMKDVIKAVCEGDGKSCKTELKEVQASINTSAISQITMVPFKNIQNKKSDIVTKIAFLDHNLQVFGKMLEKKATSIGGREVQSWITIKGTAVPIFENETKEEASERFLNEKNKTPEQKKEDQKKRSDKIKTDNEERSKKNKEENIIKEKLKNQNGKNRVDDKNKIDEINKKIENYMNNKDNYRDKKWLQQQIDDLDQNRTRLIKELQKNAPRTTPAKFTKKITDSVTQKIENSIKKYEKWLDGEFSGISVAAKKHQKKMSDEFNYNISLETAKKEVIAKKMAHYIYSTFKISAMVDDEIKSNKIDLHPDDINQFTKSVQTEPVKIIENRFSELQNQYLSKSKSDITESQN